jgi:hypothetical protein
MSETGFPGATAAIGVKSFCKPEPLDFIEPTAETPVGFSFAHGVPRPAPLNLWTGHKPA